MIKKKGCDTLKPQRSVICRLSQQLKLTEIVTLAEKLLDPYRFNHLRNTASYALKLAAHFPELGPGEKFKLKFSAMTHDLLKVKNYDKTASQVTIAGKEIECDLNRYVRLNLDELKPFGLDVYFNTDVQLHALASGMFLRSEFGIDDPQILYPIFFHSCPILPVYEQLDEVTRLMVDIMVLSDKLSSGELKPSRASGVDLSLVVWGESGHEFNFAAGLYLARLISQGNSSEKYSVMMTENYFQRWCRANPIIGLIDQPVSLKKLKKLILPKKEINQNGQEKGDNTPASSRTVVGGGGTI